MNREELVYRQVVSPTGSFFKEYANIPMLVHVDSILEISKIDRGLGGLVFREVPVEPYIKDLGQYGKPDTFSKNFNISDWSFFTVYDNGTIIAAATVACRTKEIIMLDSRDDLPSTNISIIMIWRADRKLL